MASIPEQIDRILLAYKKGNRPHHVTFENLNILYQGLDELNRTQFFEHLQHLFETEMVDGRWQKDIGVETVSVGQLIVWSFTDFGPFEQFVEKLSQLFEPTDARKSLFWSGAFRDIGSRILLNYPIVTRGVLDFLGAECRKPRQHATESLSLEIVETLQQLEKQIEEVEFLQFETHLKARAFLVSTAPTATAAAVPIPKDIDNAIETAKSYLRTNGSFDPKIAADLIRTCMDTAHRKIVQEIEPRVGRLCRGDKDAHRRSFMREVGFTTAPEDKFFAAIYTLLSEEASHKLVAPKETVLVMETVVTLYLQLLFRRLAGWQPGISP